MNTRKQTTLFKSIITITFLALCFFNITTNQGDINFFTTVKAQSEGGPGWKYASRTTTTNTNIERVPLDGILCVNRTYVEKRTICYGQGTVDCEADYEISYTDGAPFLCAPPRLQ
ncbi:hypothetical protein ACSBL2_17205 [Pedobacter sp. AW31-3R]|uniref:hypothetical protein n=1 Tax=Pedobacter sp. AW31-3R TaxID=3445781 RepID=UPI003FA019DB